MDEGMLNDLLECSVCLERLDTSSKVLPCQHTFCKKCLEEIVHKHKELRCPECRVLVDIKVEDLPPNVLLMRILEGMKAHAVPKKQKNTPKNSHASAAPVIHNVTPVHQLAPGTPDRRHVISKQTSPNVMQQPSHQPYARAVYDYLSKVQGDLNFKRGEIIILRKRIDANWYQGECGGKQGVFPLSYVQIITPLPSHIPQCKALYDFRMTNDDEEGCLTFNKGEIITVIRRVDENWAEGKLDDRIGIFPLAFVELNSLARSLMKLSTNSQPGPSRLAPPTPTTEDSAPLIPTDHSQVVSSIPVSHPATVTSSSPLIAVATGGVVGGGGGLPGSDSSSTVSSGSSSTTPNTSSSNTSSSSSTAPSSPASPPPRGQQQPQVVRSSANQSPNSAAAAAAISRAIPATAVATPPPRSSPSSASQNREKRHSFSAMNTSHPHQSSNRHSAEILAVDDQGQQSSAHSGGEKHRSGRSANEHGGGSSGNQVGLAQKVAGAVQLPAAYIALYPYKPQKADELELRKGGIYMVTERCQDGWFKGTSNRTQKCGVFPGNYVALARGVPNVQPVGGASDATGACGDLKVVVSYTRSGKNAAGVCSKQGGEHKSSSGSCSGSLQPPELPPRSGSPATTNTVISTSWHGQPESSNSAAPLGRSHSAVMNSVVTSPPNACVSSPNFSRSTEKSKERKEKSTVSLMKRLTSMKRSKSPPPTTYSMDNPVFEDTVITSSTTAPSSVLHPVHVRSGSCPSQLLQVQPTADGNASHLRLFASTSQRLKHKERPSVMVNLAHANARNTEHGHGQGATSNPNVTHHRKSNSLDAGTKTKTPQQTVRERFRCIVPYPPNSEYELELQINDIIYVHKKREDGWYKGTQQRTGRTGLFPASFVEPSV